MSEETCWHAYAFIAPPPEQMTHDLSKLLDPDGRSCKY
jgi:hypothetical protein